MWSWCSLALTSCRLLERRAVAGKCKLLKTLHLFLSYPELEASHQADEDHVGGFGSVAFGSASLFLSIYLISPIESRSGSLYLGELLPYYSVQISVSANLLLLFEGPNHLAVLNGRRNRLFRLHDLPHGWPLCQLIVRFCHVNYSIILLILALKCVLECQVMSDMSSLYNSLTIYFLWSAFIVSH